MCCSRVPASLRGVSKPYVSGCVGLDNAVRAALNSSFLPFSFSPSIASWSTSSCAPRPPSPLPPHLSVPLTSSCALFLPPKPPANRYHSAVPACPLYLFFTQSRGRTTMMRATRLRAAASVFYIPSVSFVGAGALKAAGPNIQSMNFKNPLIVTDKGIRESGLLEAVIATLRKDAGVTSVTVFDDVQPNPTVANVKDGLRMLNESGCDGIIGLGGGSPQDAAKGIALVKTNGGQIEDLEGADRASKLQFPLIAVNTTAGTASEMTRFAVITDERRHVKMVITTDMCTPLVAVNDAELMLKMPKALTAATGMDALTHAVEAYVSVGASLITDACALQAMRLIKQHLAKSTHHGSDVSAREGMSYAEFLAGMAFNSAGLGYVHAMAHQMGAVYNLPHGVCNAILLPHVEEYNRAAVPHRLRDVGEALGVNNVGRSDASAACAAIDAIRALSAEVEIPSGFKQLGAKEEDLPRLADAALLDVCAMFNPRQGSRDDIIDIYRNAM